MPEIQEISKAAMTKLAMHFTASSYCSELDLNDGDVVLVELWNYYTSDKHAPMACDQGQLDLKIPSENRNGCIQSRLNTTDIVSRKLHTIKNDSEYDTCTLFDLYKSKLIIGESSNLLFTKEDKGGKRLANEFMHLIFNDKSVYQILRGVEREVLASVASDLRFAYFTFGNNARDMAEMYGVEVLQHFHHQQVLIDRRCHGGNVLTFADDKANLQNTAKMLKVVDAGNSALREYTVQEVWNKAHDVEFSKTDGLEMAQEAKFTNKFIREVTDEQRLQSKEQRIATLNGRTDEQRLLSKENLNATMNGRTDEQRLQSKDKMNATMNGRTDEQRLLLTQRQSSSRARRHENFGWINFSSITAPIATNSHGTDIYSSPFLAAKSVCDFAGDDNLKRIATVRKVVSNGWVPIKDRQLQKNVQKYKEGKLKEDKKWRKRPTAKAPAKKRRKTVEEDNNDFSDEDENENVADRSSQAQHKGISDPNKLILSEHTQDYEQVPERKRTIPDDLGWDGIVILFDDYSPTGYQ